MAFRASSFRETGEQHLEIVIDLRDGADRAARRTDVVHLFDRDGRRDAKNGVHFRLVHPFKELPRVGRKSLNVSPLTFSVDRVKGEG